MQTGRFDVVIVGGSWAGLAGALQLARARRRVLIVDARQPRNLAARSAHGILGHDGKLPTAILAEAHAQVLAYPSVEYREEYATRVRGASDAFEVTLWSGSTVRARRLLLATGVSDVLPPIPGLVERWGSSVLHCPYCHGFEVAERRLGVLATVPASIRQAQLLPDWSADVTLFTNGARIVDATQEAGLAARGVRLEARRIAALVGRTPALGAIRLVDGDEVPLDALFTTPRTRLACPLAEQLGCALEEGPSGPLVRSDERQETTVPGVYVAGDAARASHSVSWAAADGVTAGIAAHQSLALSTDAGLRGNGDVSDGRPMLTIGRAPCG
ncbi:MAG TPA: NAD(P)/FAD-dependent oxidoreductase [Longimicrobiales bacterium]|nr:NAD(P)/FAD-dependent oxidoreductase [Longimicrobiales bacterium]